MVTIELEKLDIMLEKELALFKEKQPELRGANQNGGFVVIKDNEILGVWMNRTDAMKEGVLKWGNVPFLVKNINDDLSHVVNFSRNLRFPNAVSNHPK